MAIIRNERSTRASNNTRAGNDPVIDEELEEEIDYTWHPNEDEYVSPLTSEQWADLLRDDSFAQSDAGRAVRCLREYGEPATFQQLSIRYRGTMGRYRRWLSEAAQTAGERYGVPVPQQNQYGMDEWWPLLYQTRNAGKPGAGIFEMALRPEVEQAFLQLEEEERQAKRAENARQLQRIEKLERARQEERRRAAVTQTELGTSSKTAPQSGAAGEQSSAPSGLSTETDTAPSVFASADTEAVTAQDQTQAEGSDAATSLSPTLAPGVVSIPMSRFRNQEEGRQRTSAEEIAKPVGEVAQRLPVEGALASAGKETAHVPVGEEGNAAVPAEQVSTEPILPATREFLSLMNESPARGMRFVGQTERGGRALVDAAAPVDYALRYAERIRAAITLMREAEPAITLATIARELGDESVEQIQNIVNGQIIPNFAYVDAMRMRVFLNTERLEAPNGMEDNLPAFVTLHEAYGTDGVEDVLLTEVPRELAYVVDDSDDRRTGVIIRMSDVRCVLLTRHAVRGAARRGDNTELEAFIRMVDELDGFARAHDVLRTSRQVTTADWDDLVAGRIWPGVLLA